MGHSISIRNYRNDVADQELIDLIDAVYSGPDTGFDVVVHTSGCPDDPGRRGHHRYFPNRALPHVIELFVSPISDAVTKGQPMGGRHTVPRTVREGIFLVMAHELRHAEQALVHAKGNNKVFYAGKYKDKACEKDARSSVDDRYDIIMALAEILPTDVPPWYKGMVKVSNKKEDGR